MSSVTSRIFSIITVLFPVLGFCQIPGLDPEKSWDVNGYVRTMITATVFDNQGTLFDYQLNNRINAEYRFSSQWRFNVGMRNRLVWGDSAEFDAYRKIIGDDIGYLDLTYNWVDSNGVVGNTQLDRLFLEWAGERWQGRVGRFRINWGMTNIWNPNDIFNSYSIYEVDYPERPGSDAIYATRKLGFASEVNFAFNPTSDSEMHSYSARYLFNHLGWDGQVIVGKSRLDYIIGGGFAGDIFGASLKFESTFFSPTEDEWETVDGSLQPLNNSLVSTIEIGYSFANKRNWMTTLALLHISDPQASSSAVAFLNLPSTARTLSFTEFTGYFDASFDVTALSRMSLSGAYYDDRSYFLGVSNTYSLSDNWQLIMVAQRFDGGEASLFGDTPNTLVFANVGWNF